MELETNVSYLTSQLVISDLVVAQEGDEDINAIRAQQPLHPNFKMVNGVLCYIKFRNPVVVIPKLWQPKFLHDIHDNMSSGGHQGRDKTIARAKENGWWKSMINDVIIYVKNCLDCKKFKTPTHKFQEIMTSIKVGGPCEVWAADIAFLPESTQNNRYLLVFMEYLSKWVIAVPLSELTTDAVAKSIPSSQK